MASSRCSRTSSPVAAARANGNTLSVVTFTARPFRSEYDSRQATNRPPINREDPQRSFLYTIHATALRSLVSAPGTRRWQWGMVVSVLADESWSRRVPGKSAGDAGSGVGELVSSRREATEFYSGLRGGGASAERQRAESLPFSSC